MSILSPDPPGHHDHRRIDDIEWLRAIAVLGVVVHHASDNLFEWRPAWLYRILGHFDMWSGVDIFFVISGFVIARKLLPLLDTRPMRAAMRDTWAFWVARAFRLLPSAWLWLALMLIAAATLNGSGVFGSVHTNFMAMLAGMLQVANFRFAIAFGHFPIGTSFVYWSLSLEEQFYVVLPLLMLLLRKRVGLIVILAAAIVAQAFMPRFGMLLQVTRTAGLAWGVLLAMLSQTPAFPHLQPRMLEGRRWMQCLLGLALLATLAWISANVALPIGRRMSLVAILAILLVWLAAYNRDYLSGTGNGVVKRAMIWTGHRSYAIYLIHIPVFFLIREVWWRCTGAPAHGGAVQTLIFAAAAVVIIALLAEANYRIVEQPFRRYGRRLAKRLRGNGFDAADPARRETSVHV